MHDDVTDFSGFVGAGGHEVEAPGGVVGLVGGGDGYEDFVYAAELATFVVEFVAQVESFVVYAQLGAV